MGRDVSSIALVDIIIHILKFAGADETSGEYIDEIEHH